MVSERVVAGSGGIRGLREDIDALRALAKDEALRQSIVIGSTSGSRLSLDQLIAELETLLSAVDLQAAAGRDDTNRGLANYEYYSPDVGGASWIYKLDAGFEYKRVRFAANVSCQAWTSSTVVAEAKANLKAITQGAIWWRVDGTTVAQASYIYSSGEYELLYNGTGSSFTMVTTHKCRPGFFDTFYKVTSAQANY
jgi:hypothetical protein